MENKGAAHGFTLVELVIAVLIVAILAAVGYPSYQDQIRKGHRAAAQGFMLEVANRQQQYLLDARSYAVGAGALTAINLAVPSDVSSYYTITVQPEAPTSPPTYTIVATPLADSVQAPDEALTLDDQGNKKRGSQTGW